jgi:hypothetical protein
MLLYSFDHAGGKYSLNRSFKPVSMQIGDLPEYNLLKPFGRQEIFQMGEVKIKAKAFSLSGYFVGSNAEGDIITLNTALATCTKLYSTDHQGAGEAYVDCNGASQLTISPITHRGIKVTTHFWPSNNTWKLSADDSEVVV